MSYRVICVIRGRIELVEGEGGSYPRITRNTRRGAGEGKSLNTKAQRTRKEWI
jgi:hypothetical protein